MTSRTCNTCPGDDCRDCDGTGERAAAGDAPAKALPRLPRLSRSGPLYAEGVELVADRVALALTIRGSR